MVPPPAPRASSRRAGARLPAIDGLRGLALLGMLAWHAQVGWVRGGFARMTIFFALSGFLAATSYLGMRSRGERRPFLTFWRRRARRLLPVTLVGVIVASTVTVAVGTQKAIGDLRGDALSVLGYASNWRFVANDQSYGELFERPSAFQHFWSLSLEEQCFWLLPLVLAGALVVARRHAWAAVVVVAALLAAIPLVIEHTPDAAYYGTHVRAGEFLAGAALALLLSRVDGVPERARPTVRVVGAMSLALLLGVMLTVDRALPWLYQGGLGLFAIPAVLVIAAALDERGPVTRVLSTAPLAVVGRWAFSIYVLHWPLFMLLDGERSGLSSGWLALVQIGLAIVVGGIVHHVVERPLLGGQRRVASGPASPRLVPWWHHDGWAFGSLAAVGAAVIIVISALPSTSPDYDFVSAERLANQAPIEGELLSSSDPRAATALFGGSTAVMLGGRVWDWANTSQLVRPVPGSSQLGCGLLTAGERVFSRTRDGSLAYAPPDDYCYGWEHRWADAVTHHATEVALVLTGVWDTADWRLEGDDEWRSIGDPLFNDLIRTRLNLVVEILTERGAYVLLGTTPQVGFGADGTAREARGIGDDHAERIATYNEMVREVADRHPMAGVIDYGAFIDGLGPEQSAAWLPDGIHPTFDHALEIWEVFLGPAVEDVVARWRRLAMPAVNG
jgi:peptidoglycan/LPS O-acetylase OafA/YrhL